MAARLLSRTMQAIRINQYGGPEVLNLEHNVNIPQPDDSQVLVRCVAAGVNPVDTYLRAGVYPVVPPVPFTSGKDGAGVVEAVGSNITRFKVGDRVCNVFSNTGSYAQFFTAEPKHVFRLHDSLSFHQGAALGIPYATAYRALVTRCGARPGQTVLVHGASGAVGLAACQIARALGLTVIGTAGTELGTQLVKNNGAQQVYNHRQEGYSDKIQEETGGVDIILEMLANVNLAKDCNLCKYHAHIAVIGSRGSLEFTPRMMMGKEINVHGVALQTSTEEDMLEAEAFLYNGQILGWLKPVVGKVYPLSDAHLAQRDVIEHTDGTQGKIILDIPQAGQ